MKTKLLLALIFSGLFSASVALAGSSCPSFLKVGESYNIFWGMSDTTIKILELDANTLGCWARVENEKDIFAGAWINISQGIRIRPDSGQRSSRAREGE